MMCRSPLERGRGHKSGGGGRGRHRADRGRRRPAGRVHGAARKEAEAVLQEVADLGRDGLAVKSDIGNEAKLKHLCNTMTNLVKFLGKK